MNDDIKNHIERNVSINLRGSTAYKIDANFAIYDSMAYVTLFPEGQLGWTFKEINYANPQIAQRNCISFRQQRRRQCKSKIQPSWNRNSVGLLLLLFTFERFI
jgi:hypothetical protein